MTVRIGLLTTAVLVGLTLAPIAQARDWHDRGRGDYGRRDYGHHHGGGEAAVIGGLIGLGLGAAIASQGGYAAPPPAYYGAPRGYYAPPPAVYYGY
jgi:hypothetical protein